ncbi:MAG: hypothetical protein LBH98_09715 [Chitinispirillales bacterium]|nr:hypothetical protein [Chitinispirillales bacterium]
MKRIRLVIMLMFITFAFVYCNEQNTKLLLAGQWNTVESNLDKDLICDRVEFFNDGTGVSEWNNLRGVGAWAESFTWKIGADGRLIMMAPNGMAQIYSIVEISKSTLVLEGNVPGYGNVREKYSKLK